MNDLDEVTDARAIGHLGRGEQDGGRVGVVIERIDREKCARSAIRRIGKLMRWPRTVSITHAP